MVNWEKDQRQYVYWRLGKEGIPFEQVRDILSEAFTQAHGFQRGVVQVPGTPIEVFWEPGIDGLDGWHGIREPE